MHVPVGCSTVESCQDIPNEDTQAKKISHLAPEFSAGFGWFGTLFPHITRTISRTLLLQLGEKAK
jgi:hypothetical protein